MDINEQVKQMKAFDDRWGIKNKHEPSETFRLFKRALIQAFHSLEDKMPEESKELFAYAFGLERSSNYGNENTIVEALESEEDSIIFYKKLEFLFSLKFDYNYWNYYLDKLIKILALQPVNISLTKDKSGNMIIIPKGEEFLDSEIVTKVMGFLDEKSNEHFLDSLKEYQTNKKSSRIKSCEQLRRALEEYLRFKLGNTKNLSNNILVLLIKLKEKGTNKEIRNLIQKNFNYLDKYFNEHSKHGDGEISEIENELLIYQVGLLLRYIYQSLD